MTITIHKCDMNGTIQVSYNATIIFQSSKKIVVDTYFSYKKNFCIGGLTLNNGDRCIEAFYYDKWYNIFEVYAQNSNELKGWYCNITKPFHYENKNIYYYDLALDLVVLKDGTESILDEDEFEQLHLDKTTQERAWKALQNVQNILKTNEVPLRKYITD